MMRISAAGKLYAAIGGLFFALILLGVWLEHRILPSLFILLDDDIQSFISRTLFYVGGQPVRVWFLIKTALYLVFLTLMSRLAEYLIRRITRHNPGFGEHRQYVLSRIVSFFIYVAGILIGIHVERIQLSTLVVVGGTLGVGIGLGLQSLVGNLVAGFTLFVEQPIRIGDMIEFGNKAGEVVRIGTRCSWIKTPENALIIIPNSELMTKDFLNWTLNDPKVRVSVPIAVIQGSDISRVIQVLLGVAKEHVDVLEHPLPEVILIELGQSAISLALRAWTIKGAQDFAKFRSDLYLLIIQRFGENDIVLPFPQLRVDLQSDR